ncbi:hypothetical protein H4V95_002165 [Arthrobacter sp. CAN_C5]|nr:hypothetical protein [Arthrobacter sp. CAN_C5]
MEGLLYVVSTPLLGLSVIHTGFLSRGAGVLLTAAAALTPVAGDCCSKHSDAWPPSL